MKRRMRSAAIALGLLVATTAACGSNNKDAESPTSTLDGGADASAFAPATDAAAPDAGAGDAAIQAPDMTAALDLAIDTEVNTQAAKLAPKMTLEGQIGRATLQEGERFNMVVTLAPGKCYTFVGFSPMGQVSELELKLMLPPFYNTETAKSGKSDANRPVIGKGATPQCPISPIAMPYRLDAAAMKGAGRVGVYVYSRSK